MESTQGTHAYELSNQPAQTLSQRVMVDFFALTRSELQLVLLEVDQKTRAGARAGAMCGLASVFGLVALVGVFSLVVNGFALFLPGWLAEAIAVAAFAVPAALFAQAGRSAWLASEALPTSRVLDGLWSEFAGKPGAAEIAQQRAQSARADLDRDVAALAQRSNAPSPVRDTILSEMAMTMGSVIKASKGSR